MQEETIMPIAIPFKLKHKLEGKIAEYNIKYKVNRSTLENLFEFLDYEPVHRVNVEFLGDIPMDIAMSAKYSDKFYVRIMPNQIGSWRELAENNIKFFFDCSASAVCNMEQLKEFIEIGVTDVYLADDLTYMLKEAKNYCAEHGVQTRLIVNNIPLTTPDKGDSPMSPIYRPQDVDTLKTYFDIFEFDYGDKLEWARLDTLIKVYMKDQYWHGNIQELNPDLNIYFPNDCFFSEYSSYRTNCGKRCAKGGVCRKCEKFYETAMILSKKGLRIENG